MTRLATPPGAQERLSDYRPEQAFQPLAPGVGSRTVFTAESGEGYRIEIRDVLVGPKQAASELTLPGPAVLEVRSGSGALTIGGETRELPIGSTAAIEQGQSFDLRNTSDGPLTVRLVVFVAE